MYFSLATYRKCDLSLVPPTESLRHTKVKWSPFHLGGVGVCYSFQIDQNAAENFNLTSDGEFNAIKSLVLGKVHGKETGSGFSNAHLHRLTEQTGVASSELG